MNQTTSQAHRLESILAQVKVNAPAVMMIEGLMEKILTAGIHPEVGLDARALEELPRSDLKNLADRLHQAGRRSTIHGPFVDLSGGALDPKILEISRQRYQQALDAAMLFQPEHIVFHPGYDADRHYFYRERWLAISMETWMAVILKAHRRGLRVVLENTFEEGPEVLLELMTVLGPAGAGFCLDVGHATVFGKKASLHDWLDAFAPYLEALHLHDNHGQRDEHLGLGQGNLDFRRIFNWLIERGIRPRTITLEPHQEDQLMPSLTTLADLWPWPST